MFLKLFSHICLIRDFCIYYMMVNVACSGLANHSIYTVNTMPDLNQFAGFMDFVIYLWPMRLIWFSITGNPLHTF